MGAAITGHARRLPGMELQLCTSDSRVFVPLLQTGTLLQDAVNHYMQALHSDPPNSSVLVSIWETLNLRHVEHVRCYSVCACIPTLQSPS